jgi:hypothetical protein
MAVERFATIMALIVFNRHNALSLTNFLVRGIMRGPQLKYLIIMVAIMDGEKGMQKERADLSRSIC